jgi:hypothetical protein
MIHETYGTHRTCGAHGTLGTNIAKTTIINRKIRKINI